MKNPASCFDLAYLSANGEKKNIAELAAVARNIGSRSAIVHCADIKLLREALDFERDKNPHSVMAEIVIDFPDGAGGDETKLFQARSAALFKADGADIVINLRWVKDKNSSMLLREFRAVAQYFKESKAIIQLPYLWQFQRDDIGWLLELLVEGGVKYVKDWTTRSDNFTEKVPVDDDTRIAYLEYISEYIAKHSLPLKKKIAGKVTPENARRFLDAGADVLGIGYGKAFAVQKALMGS
ncbi:MAG: hypothetical protein A3A28_04815 [Candidatus Sungbacteria bacterium RIFCSPLOWO2_01_FULL_47_32]|uniref:Uncharacterized protein n=1 Tax=Candidatus Sungbacteria bacterium RIFCSPHIGHO2_01_FULL_47_32 TaxID=1802264 RepID=A0A1G2K7B3_9BACT|nr:MAG: Deoxyribose-phosphate aldolase [Parcubacteria group bacterium GW2011_GWA2_47_10]OGZ95322.1 MAG: hypothetical protein A2633_03015 [Candidatus Sungbacteria bacterium RIFCSPHIGHO2_01_FULL_47_32]OHA06357.1 MAG: hypothetical protein A3A28_04815 [Candidatus Sungbacteria bacterium RIFCSPLOWO2_01_FULL_47_32]